MARLLLECGNVNKQLIGENNFKKFYMYNICFDNINIFSGYRARWTAGRPPSSSRRGRAGWAAPGPGPRPPAGSCSAGPGRGRGRGGAPALAGAGSGNLNIAK